MNLRFQSSQDRPILCSESAHHADLDWREGGGGAVEADTVSLKQLDDLDRLRDASSGVTEDSVLLGHVAT
jgi:hypothetical protein